MVLIDADIAQKLGPKIEKLETPISVNGIGSQHLSREWIKLHVYFMGPDATARLTMEAHLVPDLKAKLLIGTDVLGPEGFKLDFDRKIAQIASCRDMHFPISTQSKPNRLDTKPVFSKEKVVIPPHTRINIPIKFKEKDGLPLDRAFLFCPNEDQENTLHAHIIRPAHPGRDEPG